MENLHPDHLAFGPVTLQRPMQLFKGALSHTKVYGEPFEPDPEFLVRLVTDYRSHTAMMRKSTGDHFKNFENHIRGKHQLSTTTISEICKQLGLTPETLEGMAHGKKDGPLLPTALVLFSMMESIPYSYSRHILDIELICPCCKKNVFDDQAAFWSKQAIFFNQTECSFADRILTAIVGLFYIGVSFSSYTENKIVWSEFCKLAHPDRHPIGHWLSDIQACFKASSLSQLATKIQLMGLPKCNVPPERLKKWSSGMDLIPVSVGMALSKSTNSQNWFLFSFFIARALSFTTDFLVAAAPGEKPKKAEVQKIVEKRLTSLYKNTQLAIKQQANNSKTATESIK